MTEEKEIEKSESSRSTFNDADKIVEDTSGFKKECIIEAEGNLPEDAAPESVIKPRNNGNAASFVNFRLRETAISVTISVVEIISLLTCVCECT